MPKHLIVATLPDRAPPRYFMGYRNDWAANEAFWTLDPTRAAWIEADEAAVEIRLLGLFYPSCRLASRPLNTVGMSETL